MFLEDISENAAKARAQKRKPREPKPREKKSADQPKGKFYRLMG
jgi:hypothetical protein